MVTAESCTGGLVAGAPTAIAGSSDVVARVRDLFERRQDRHAWYSIRAHRQAWRGASEPVARAMAEGALSRSAAEISVAITGIAGPAGPRRPSLSDWCIWQRRDAAADIASRAAIRRSRPLGGAGCSRARRARTDRARGGLNPDIKAFGRFLPIDGHPNCGRPCDRDHPARSH